MQERESATRKNGGGVFYFLAHMCHQYIIWPSSTRLLLLLYLFSSLYALNYVPCRDCRRHYRLDTNIRRPSYCQQTKKLVGFKSRKKNPQKLTPLSSRYHPRHLVGKRTAQKDTIIDITSDSQVNSNFPCRWSPASLTFNNYFYLFLYLYIT